MVAANDNSPGIEDKKQKSNVLNERPGRCNAKKRNGEPCQRYPMRHKTRCKLHGGATTGARTPEGRLMQAIKDIRTGLTMSPNAARLVTAPNFQPDAAFGKCFCINRYEEDFCDFFFQIIEAKFTITDRTQLFFAGQMAIMILRGITGSKSSGRVWDFSRMLDSFNRTMRELDMTRNAKSGCGKDAPKIDIMVMIQNYRNKIDNKKNEPQTEKTVAAVIEQK